MEDLSRKISELLSDPQALEQIRGLTGLLGQTQEKSEQPEHKETPDTAEPSFSGMPDPNMIGMIMKFAPLLQSAKEEDDSTRLLKALKPFMHDERSKRIDGAIRLLGIMKVLPLLKSAGPGLFG